MNYGSMRIPFLLKLLKLLKFRNHDKRNVSFVKMSIEGDTISIISIISPKKGHAHHPVNPAEPIPDVFF